jgi:uncharacterized protein YndB with AHSA1/START domain
MAEAERKAENLVLTLRRKLAVPRERVFRALTTPEELMRWFGPSDDFRVPSAEVDLRVGGRYRIAIIGPSGNQLAVGGTYREIHPPERLQYTWRWEDGGDETLVTFALRDLGGDTELTLTQERFATAESRDRHNEGWSGSLDRLERAVR